MKLFCELKKNDKVYMAYIPEHDGQQPQIKKLYVADITPTGKYDGYSIFTMKPVIYTGLYNHPEYKASVLMYELDHCSVLSDNAYDLENSWNVRYFTTEQAAIDFIVHHYECEIHKQLNIVSKFKQDYGNATYDLIRFKTKEYKDEEETYTTYRKYEIYDFDEGTKDNKKFEKKIEKSKYLVYSRKVALDWYGNEKSPFSSWRYDERHPVCMFDTLEEASDWVTKHDKSRHESGCDEVTRYSIKSIKEIKEVG